MSKHLPQSENMKALEQSLNDHMEICSLKRKAKRLKAENARLKAEVERLDILCKQLSKQHSDISCENIILRKAGDAMYVVIYGFNWLAFNKDITNTLNAWNAAKEGKGQP